NSFPGKTLSWISLKHAKHHKDMQQGNYSTITLIYDKVFKTLV
ncbi:MAG: sterol desaturase/sphingolipid hydroxylase (fatty acid hydroxylase superfamily), partial [Bacteroidia bacterium]